MKRIILTMAIILYTTVIVLSHCFGNVMRDAFSYPVTATNIFVHDSDTLHSMFSLPAHCIYQNPEDGTYFVYILDQGDMYDDDGYYIIQRKVEISGQDGEVVAVRGIHDEPVVASKVTEDMVGQRAVIDEWIEYTGGDGT